MELRLFNLIPLFIIAQSLLCTSVSAFSVLPGQVHFPLPQSEQDSIQEVSKLDHSDRKTISFRLDHVYATTSSSRVLFANVANSRAPAITSTRLPSYSIRTKKISTHKPTSLEAFNRARFSSYTRRDDSLGNDTMLWEEEEIIGPDVTDRETILLLAKMTNNAYNIDHEEDDWYDIGEEWNKASSLLGATFGNPVVAFEAPGERMAAQRLHLPSPPSSLHITHIYHTADPIPMGVCTGVLSSCALVGYALESRCHLGQSIVYDTVTKLNWSVNVAAHRIRTVVDSLLSEDWEEGKPLPDFSNEDDCIDCYSWEYVDP
ncbi:hypothetical protein Clacol_002905 [Clathrus columnatus]|uniref:triacylglycerol lipase n=1 Tax=Clathrus columnatus TaxID=1419009 RepID=A0AAV5A202_9AGAM|nr:hypothetical protein Clacol_002905 [Clathrus columnatus]